MRQDISLRKPSKIDILKLAWWLGKPHVKAFWRSPRCFMGRVRKYGKRLSNTSSVYPFMIALNGEAIGYLQFTRSKTFGRGHHWELDILIGQAQWTGKGIGPKALALCEQHLVQQADARSVSVDPLATNHRAIRAFIKSGYKSQGTAPSDQGIVNIMIKELV